MNDTDDSLDTICLDKHVLLTCSDRKNILLSQNRLSDFVFFKKIFADNPEVKEIPLIHTRKDIIRMLELIDDDVFQSEDLLLLIKLYPYYKYDGTHRIIDSPCKLEFITPDSEAYFEEQIKKVIREYITIWPKNLKLTDRIKAMVVDVFIRFELNLKYYVSET